MRILQGRSIRKELYLIFVFSFFCVFIFSCSANLNVVREAQQTDEDVLASKFSIVFVIHGDGDYLFHDTNGNEYEANEETLEGAKMVAQQNPNAEVFIFHQRPKRHFLLFFPLRDGEFYYYRNGKFIANESYWRNQEQSKLGPEVELYRRFRTDNQSEMMSMFLYFGHEIPEINGAGYDASYPDRTFTVVNLASGLKNFTHDSTKFDLMILSTCFGGTPYTIGTLRSFARYVVASPGNLHLSYFNLHSLERLDTSLHNGDMYIFAKRFAHQSFDRLTRDIQTAVSIAVYDMDSVKEYLDSVHKIYYQTLTTSKRTALDYLTEVEHCDCADISEYAQPSINKGVDVFYQPARFGRLKNKKFHSGWECWRHVNQ